MAFAAQGTRAADASSTFSATTSVTLSDYIINGHPDTTTVIDIAGGDLNLSSVVLLTPNTTMIAAGTVASVGTTVGGVEVKENYSVSGGPCNTFTTTDYVLYNVALPGSPATMAYPLPEGTPDRFSRWKIGSEPDPNNPLDGSTITDVMTAGIADSGNLPIMNFPQHLPAAIDPDGFAPPAPKAVYGGLSKIGNEWQPLYLVQFDAGALTILPPPLGLINAAMGQPALRIAGDPTVSTRAPNPLLDACTPFTETTTLLGVLPGPINRVSNPTGAGTQFYVQYLASGRDTDQDGYENAIDSCPLTVNAGDPRGSLGDSDGDGIDDSCDPAPSTPTADIDGDGYDNRDDNCPLVANGTPPTAQHESEVSVVPADRGPRTDEIGDPCDAGTISVNQNGANVNITLSDAVANGRYMSVTNVVARCIEASLPLDQDNDGDGYCINQDAADSGGCQAENPPSCFTRHNQWSGATHPALQMDTDGDKISDARETYNGTDPTKSCSATATTDSEPLDNWIYDLNDNTIVNGQDSGSFGGAGGSFGQNVVNGPFHGRPGTRYDFRVDGQINGGDTGQFGGVGPYTGGNGPFNMTCVTAGIPPFSQQ